MEQSMNVILIISIIAIALCVASVASIISGSYPSKTSMKEMDKAEKRFVFGAEGSENANVVEKALVNFQNAYDRNEAGLSAEDRVFYKNEIEDLKIALRDIELERFGRKADPVLLTFQMCFLSVLEDDKPEFSEVDILFEEKKKCIQSWKKYFDLDTSKYKVPIDRLQYMKDYLGEDYQECMRDVSALENALNESTKEAESLYNRKMLLCRRITTAIRVGKDKKRVDLLRQPFDGYTQEEVQACYKYLKKKKKITETNIGGRVYVSLSATHGSKRS